MNVPLDIRGNIGIVVSLRFKTGISRVTAMICQHFGDKVVVLTDKYDKALSQEIPPSTIVYEMEAQAFPLLTFSSILLNLFSNLHKILISILTSWNIIRRQDVRILNPHGPLSLILSCILKLLSFYRKIKISYFLYDKEDIYNPLLPIIRIFMRLKLIDQILVLNNRMNKIVRLLLNTNNVYTIRIGIGSDIIKLYEQSLNGSLRISEKLRKHLGQHPLTGKITKIYFHGILIPRRRIEDLLSALVILKGQYNDKKKIVLYISGSTTCDKSYVDKLMRFTKVWELESNVVFLGSLSDEELAFLYQLSDIFVFPCDENQTWGLAPLEAMLFKKPVIIMSEAGISEVLTRDMAIVIPSRSPEKLAESIELLIENKQLQMKLGTNGHEYVKKHFTHIQTMEQLEKLWSSI